MSGTKKILICGGGNGAHVLAPIASSLPGHHVRVLELLEANAKTWNNEIQSGAVLNVKGFGVDNKPVDLSQNPHIVSHLPEVAAKDFDMAIFVAPSFASQFYIDAIKPFIRPGCVIVAMPGGAGFEFQITSSLGDLADKVTILNYITLPFNCRIVKYGCSVNLMSIKKNLDGALKEAKVETLIPAIPTLATILGECNLRTRGHLIGSTLEYNNAVLHPTIMYSKWHNWDGLPIKGDVSLFYQGVDSNTCITMNALKNEILEVGKKLVEQNGIELDLRSQLDLMISLYGDQIHDKSTLIGALAQNDGFTGLKHPVKMNEDESYVPDFTFRYLTEDIPFGLVPLKGIALIAGVETPTLDKILLWGQSKINKEYLVDGKLTGKDVGTTRAPQRYRINNQKDLLFL